MKKGFTIVEIIFSIAILLSVSALSIILFVNKNNTSVEDELYNIVTTSSYANLNKSNGNIKSFKENLGYQVYTINELIDVGLLDENRLNIFNTIFEL